MFRSDFETLTKVMFWILIFTVGYVLGFNTQPQEPQIETKIVPVYIREKCPEREEPVRPEDQEITTKNEVRRISDSEFDLLARLVSAEARGESFEGKVAVANVVLNRVDSPKWQDTVSEVIEAPRQFQPVSNGAIHQEPTKDSIRAVLKALEGEQVVPKSVDSFAHYSVDFSNWATFHTQIGKHKFWTSNGGV